jgi:hypothetical protein
MTQEWLDNLPENLSAGQVHKLLGTTEKSLAVLRAEHPEMIARRMGSGGNAKCKYVREVVFAIGKIRSVAAATSNQAKR